MVHAAIAANFYKQCLYLSDVTLGNDSKDAKKINNDEVLLNLDSNMRLHTVTTCTTTGSSAGELTGARISVLDPAKPDSTPIELPLIGVEGKGCMSLKLTKLLDKIEASSDDNVVNSIRYVVKPNQKTYGTFNGATSAEWTFTEQTPMVGIYGQMTKDKITQLGFITTSPECEVKVAEDKGEAAGGSSGGASGTSENATGSGLTEESESESEGSSMNLIIIIIAVVVVIAVVIVIVLIMRGRGKSDKGKVDAVHKPINSESKATLEGSVDVELTAKGEKATEKDYASSNTEAGAKMKEVFYN